MRVLVTGGAGYIGSAVTDRLLRDRHSVTVIDNLSRGRRDAVPALAEFVQADIGDTGALGRVFHGCAFDAVMHFAGFIEAGESMLLPEIYFDNNATRTLTLLRAVAQHRVPRFIFSSTAAVYGEPGHIPIDEDAPLQPESPYGESKLMVERMLHWFHKIFGLRYACLRYFNTSGAIHGHGEAHRPETHLIPLVLQAALGQTESISIYGADYPTQDGTCVRDYLHLEDLITAHLLAMDALSERSRLICNVGTGQGYSVRQVIDAARRISGREIPVVEAPRRPGDPAVLIANPEKIKRELGWRPQFSDIDTIIRSAWEWQSANLSAHAG
jgi:UDP-glucose 4-epimerase